VNDMCLKLIMNLPSVFFPLYNAVMLFLSCYNVNYY
jgi:hypothetical protein